MKVKVLELEVKTYNQKSNSAPIDEEKKSGDRKPIPVKNKSIFPLPLRKMVWKKINGKLLAEWIPTR